MSHAVFTPPVQLRTQEDWAVRGYRLKREAEPKGSGPNSQALYADYDVVFEDGEGDSYE